ncbi:hypothetical protein [Streptomyces sp. NPDC051569]|uniref:hypothetical protein n=1 Tax=Streptomyces sp. NPDC051569 TaxID=3365661 RepID=UPI0037A509CA
MNAYSYAHNNPVTKSDPTGLRPAGPTDGGASADDAWARDRGMNAGYVLKNGKYVWVQTPKKDKASQKKYAAYQANPSNYKVYHYNAKVAAASKAAAEARAADRAKAAQEQRRKEDGIFGSITKGNWSNAWENAKESTKDAFDYASTYSNTSGICVSAGGAIGLGIEFTGCIIGTKRPDGKTDYSLSGTFEEQVGPGVGGAATLSAVYSNADDIDQIRGEAAGMGGTVGYGLAFNGSHRGTFGTRNSRGDIVHSFTQGVGAGYGAEANFGSGVTGVHKLFTW